MANSKVSLVGKLRFDPELRYTAEGKAVCNFKLWNEDEGLVSIATWETLAEACNQELETGEKYSIVGYRTSREYEGQTYKGVTARRVFLLDHKPGPLKVVREIGRNDG